MILGPCSLTDMDTHTHTQSKLTEGGGSVCTRFIHSRNKIGGGC